METIREPNMVKYIDMGGLQIAWNFDKLPAGKWKVQTSPDLLTWTDEGTTTERKGVSCYTVLLTPQQQFARMARVN